MFDTIAITYFYLYCYIYLATPRIPPSTAYRRLQKLKTQGDLRHGNIGNHNHPSRSDKGQIINLIHNQYNLNFSYTHLSELLLSRENISVPSETLRRWLNCPRIHKKAQQRQRRERRTKFGVLLQIDGSFEKWFGNTKSFLMNIVDDATNVSELHFAKEETIESACLCAWNWFKKYGVPHAFYADGRNMYHFNPDCEHNFFTAMCERLGIRVILARSPQAKGVLNGGMVYINKGLFLCLN